MAPPLRPDAPTAHRWLADELENSRYQERLNLLELLADWLDGLFRPGAASPPPVGVVVAIILGALLVVVLIFIIRRFPVGARARKSDVIAESEVGPLDDPARHRQAAERHRAAGAYAAAVIESFRALVATAIERNTIEASPGLTAQSAAQLLIAEHRSEATDLRRAADLFDRARYGDARPGGARLTAEDAVAVAELEQRVAGARAARTVATTEAGA